MCPTLACDTASQFNQHLLGLMWAEYPLGTETREASTPSRALQVQRDTHKGCRTGWGSDNFRMGRACWGQ